MKYSPLAVIGMLLLCSCTAQKPLDYEIGGPLAGVTLPPMKTQFGEPAGYPGALPERMDRSKADGEGNVPFTAQGQPPELELYPGSVEHWRTYMFKYLPVRSTFDRQSQVRNFVSPHIPGTSAGNIEQYAEPLYWVPRHAEPINTGKKRAPVSVVRCKPEGPVFKLDLGELEAGLYAVRVIGAVPTDKLREFRSPIYLRMSVNDGKDGEASNYRVRIGYCDEFYSVAEIYFHAPAKRAYVAELTVDRGSEADLLVHNISLDDVLAGIKREPIKSRTTLSRENIASTQPAWLSKEDRLARDAGIWNSFPPLNAQSGFAPSIGGVVVKKVEAGTDTLTRKEIEDKWGVWEMPQPPELGVLIVNKKLALKYTYEDLRSKRPLPDPYPFKDDGAGLFFPDPNDPSAGRYWSPIADAVSLRICDAYYPRGWPIEDRSMRGARGIVAQPEIELIGGPTTRPVGLDAVHDSALALVRYAWQFPAIDSANDFSSLIREHGPLDRDYRCRRRETTANYLSHYATYVRPLYEYDRLFDYIKDNQDLADSVGRFVPWVKTPQDVVKLIDVYLVQMTAKRILRYQYHTDPMEITNIAAIVGNNAVTEPWMQWQFARTFIYPLPPVGIADAMITGCERDGCEWVGSTYYAMGEGATRTATTLERYVKAGGDPKYTLSDEKLYPKPVAQTYWRLKNMVAGTDPLRIADVMGPDKPAGSTLQWIAGGEGHGVTISAFAVPGWNWTRDPKFAFLLKHYVGRTNQSDEEWAQIEKAAATVARAPWLDNRSRVLPMWAGILESGTQHDDPRLRAAAYVRTGFGYGHHHHDSMDLQIVAQGLPATIDAGQRTAPRYSSPSDRSTRIHNTVEVDGRDTHVYSWVKTLSDAEGARYLAVEAAPPEGVTYFARQIALVDVSEGKDARKLSPAEQYPTSKLPPGVTPAQSYIFDVFRVSGGKMHTYCFHANVNDELAWNATDVKPVPTPAKNEPADADAQYLAMFDRKTELKAAGNTPEMLQATWRQLRPKAEGKKRGFGSEEFLLGANYDPAAPRRFTRLSLFGAEGARALKAQLDCFKWDYNFTCLMVQRKAEDAQPLESAFAAIIDPYMGSPFISSQRALPIYNNETDALCAVAVEVTTTNGHTDVCFADARPEKLRYLTGSDLTAVAAEFAYYSKDAQGLRLASITGGTRLFAEDVEIVAAQRQRTATVTKVDYLNKTLWLDQPWPARRTESIFEIGLPGHMTTYTAASTQGDSNRTRLTVTQGADYYRSPIEEINPAASTVRCTLPLALGQRPGIDKHWVATDDAMKTFWRADVLDRGLFKLTGPPLTKNSFGPSNRLRLWEYGPGDTVRQSTTISLRRLSPGLYQLTTTTPVTISLRAKSAEVSQDQKTWTPVHPTPGNPWTVITIADDAVHAPTFIKVAQ